MKALHIHAGPRALAHLRRHGLQPEDVRTIPAAAGGPKGLILGPLDRFIFGEWLPRSQQPVHLVGASIGAWRMATACVPDSRVAFARLEHDYIHQQYDPPPGRSRPTPQQVSERFGQTLQAFYGGQVAALLQHPRYRLHIVTARGRHVLAREHRLGTPLGYLGAFLANAVHRKALGAWLERVVFSSPDPAQPAGACAALPFGTHDIRTRQLPLTPANFMQALQASCSIPFVLQAVPHIAGAPPGAYWDGGITDYHMHLPYESAPNAIENGAGSACPESAGGQKGLKSPGLVLYPHFQREVVPGWLDKQLKWRHQATAALDGMVLLAPNPEWVRQLPNGKLPDRQDFTHYGLDTAARVRAWQTATAASQQLADELADWLDRPRAAVVRPLAPG
jgi:hypothetical protein